jgi:hypothetical protein
MAHLELGHADMKPAPIVRYEIAQEQSRMKTLLVGMVIAAAMIVVMAAMFLTAIR